MKNLNILVIGGAGFIGSHLCEKLCSTNNVVSLDNYLTGSKDNHIKGVNYIEGSCTDIDNVNIDMKPDIVFHLGEYSRVESSFDDYDLVIRNNLHSMMNVLNYVKKIDAKIIYAGSSTKFGDDLGGLNASPYAWSKYTNTQHLKNYANWFGLNYAIVYFYNAYGGREINNGKYATLIGIYKNLYHKNIKSFPVVRPGTQVRNFTHYSDIVNGLVHVAQKGSGDGYGIGSDYAYSILEIVEFLGGTPEFLPTREGNRLTADLITRKTKNLGWAPKYDLKDYLKNLKKP